MKIKEKILKLGKRKNCFIALLLCVLLAFTIISGLNGSKSCEIKANAQTAPQTKNLDLNGIRYTYQTSINELKNQYNLFKKWYYVDLFRITNNTEGETQILLQNQEDDMSLDEQQIDSTLSLLIQSINFYVNIEGTNAVKTLDNNLSSNKIDGNNTTNNLVFDYDNINNFERLKNFSVNFTLLKQIPYFNSGFDDLEFNSFTMNFIYVKDNIDNTQINNIEYMDKNVKCFAYCFSNQVDYYNFELPILQDYTIRNIYLTTEETDETDNNAIIQSIPEEFIFLNKDDMYDVCITIEKINFINNSQSNIISYFFNYNRLRGENTVYKGNILLSTEKYDELLFRDLAGNIGATTDIAVNIGKGFFGGYNENKAPLNYIYYGSITAPGLGGVGCYNDKNTNSGINYRNYSLFFGFINPIDGDSVWTYRNQNQLLYLDEFSSLRTTHNNQSYAALSAQVEDILYNVNYVGNIEEMEFNEKVEEDFQNLLKLTGLGAFIGLVLGLIFGNPALGAAIGAMWGALIALFPLLIDGLQALFGYNFLSGLYNFFKSITNFFANFVDTIINFFVSIITNPFVLILIVIVAIIFVITYFQNK